MILTAPFTIKIRKGDYRSLIKKGKRYIKKKGKVKEGIKMLLSAYSMASTSPEADSLLVSIAEGFKKSGDNYNAALYYNKLYHFYPDSRFSSEAEKKFNSNLKYHFPVDYYGKRADIILQQSNY